MNKKLGFYKVGNTLFDSKIQALLYATSLYNKLGVDFNSKKLVHWDFNDSVFASYDWTKEPEESLTSLYRKRARELRSKYDYIIISYSGGSDSHNIVRAFLDQKLLIDELFVVTLNQNTNKFTIVDPNNTEATHAHASDMALQTIPRLRDLLIESPSTFVRYVDVSDLVFKVFNSKKDASWVLTMKEELNPVDVTRYNYASQVDFRKILDKNLNIGIVVGIDKPKVFIDIETDLMYTRFVDRLTNTIPIGEYIKEYTNTTVEFFYWSPDSVDMLCKQAHTVKKWLEANPLLQGFFTNIDPPSTITNARKLHEKLLRLVLYDNWNSSWFQADKPLRDWFTEEDTWFITGAAGQKAHSIWLEGIKYIIDNTGPFIRKWGKNPDAFIQWHKDYYIGKLNRRNYDS